jgi:signal transduction histidine kinase/CheY-like chemotaxis protein
LSFAAIAQLAPAFFGGLIWRRATARGAIAGMTIGILAWIYTLLLPSFAQAGLLDASIVTSGPWGIAALRPQALLGVHMDPFVHGVAWSLILNVIAYLAFSLHREPASIERLQANLFFPPELAPVAPSFLQRRASVTVGEISDTVARYLGDERTRSAFASFASARGLDLDPTQEADFHLLRYAEHLLASAIGAASSRLVLSLVLRKRTMSTKAALKLLDDANTAIQYNREIMQSALDHVRQGIAVFDKDLRLVCWNRYFGEILNLPSELVRIGIGLDRLLQFEAEQGALGPGHADDLVRDRITRYVAGAEPILERFLDRGLVVELRTNAMPDGGIVATLTDITPSVAAAEALERANENLERRVRERTDELTRLNAALTRAKAEADDANISKTRFLAAASHDILQPLNAARLYVTSLVERQSSRDDGALVGNIDASLEAVEEILAALLDISRLDAGAMKPEIATFRIDELLRQLEVEFAPLARENGLALAFVPCSLAVRSDRRLLRRLLQNLVSNAIKYTPSGRVLVGCRRRGERLRIDVYDTGVGVPPSQRRSIFREFHRLDHAAKGARGLGLGLSIVERIARVLDHKIEVQSSVGRGSRFSVEVPQAPALPAGRPVRSAPRADAGQLADMTVVCIDNEAKILDGMETLLGGWGCRVLAAPDLRGAQAAIASAKARPNGLLVDYHLAESNGIDAIAQLRWQFGADLPAILITADRSPRVREEARARDIQVLNKPIKPAAHGLLLFAIRYSLFAIRYSLFAIRHCLRPIIRLDLGGGDHRLGAAFHPELLQDCRDVRLHRGFGHAEPIGDLFVEQAFREHHQHAHLLRREAREPADQVGGGGVGLAGKIDVRGRPHAAFEHAGDRRPHGLDPERLRDETRRPERHAAANHGWVVVGGDHHHRHARELRAQKHQPGKSAHPGHGEIEQNEVDLAAAIEFPHHVVEAAGLGDLGAGELARNRRAQGAAEQRVIVGDHQTIGRFAHARTRASRKRPRARAALIHC